MSKFADRPGAARLPRNWQALRKMVISRDKVCKWGSIPDDRAIPGWESRPHDGALECDHVGAPADHRPEMLRALCAGHHRMRTAWQASMAAKAKRDASPKARPARKHPGLR